MKIFAKCSTCKTHVSVKTKAISRPELAQEKGETFSLNCDSCGITFSRHTNEIRAKDDYRIIVNTLLITALISILSYFFVGLFGTISLLVPMVIWQNQTKKVHAFNSYMI